jgi:hypothetical protein
MFVSHISTAIFAIATLVPSAQAQTCYGDAKGITEPNWNMDYAWYLRGSMCAEGGCSSARARNAIDLDCRKIIIPDQSYDVTLKGNVTGQTDTQFSQDCYDKVVRLASTEI